MAQDPAPSGAHPRRILNAALKLAEKGWPVFPCQSNTKQPLTSGGFKDATTDLEQVRLLWGRIYKGEMIGIPTGPKPGGIGAVVIDLDPKDGDTPERMLSAICAVFNLASLPPCPMARTPRGGLHLYFTYPEAEKIGNRADMLKHLGVKGVDIRGAGGYVISPPSVRSGPRAEMDGCDGVPYTWEEDASPDELDLPPLPDVLLHEILTGERNKEASQKAHTAPDSGKAASPRVDVPERLRKYALAALDAESRAAGEAAQGSRNDALNRAAFSLGQLVGAGLLNESAVQGALENAAAASGLLKDDGLPSVRKTIASGLHSGMGQPRDLAVIESQIEGSSRNPSSRKPQGSREGKAKDKHSKKRGGAGPDETIENREPDPVLVEELSALPQNDYGNGQRLKAHFRGLLLNVREIGPHFWTGTHWEATGGIERWQRAAHKVAEWIGLESFYIDATPREVEILEAWDREDKTLLSADGRKIKSPEERAELKRLRELEDAAIEVRRGIRARKSGRAKFAISSGNGTRTNAMIQAAMPYLTVAPEDLDADPLAINVENGTLRLKKDKETIDDPDAGEGDERKITVTRWKVYLTPHNSRDLISKCMPVKYEANATCPKWMEFVARFQPEEDVRLFLRAFHGYALTGLTGEQVFVFNYGLGANGKTTFMETLARLMGDYAQVLPAEALTGHEQRRGDQATPEFARLPGARLVRCAELPRGQGFRENTLKMLTGGETMLVRHLHARFFELTPVFKAIGSGNDRPNIGGVDEGIWRRVKLVPWPVQIGVADRRPMEKVLAEFAAESSGILNWLLDGLCDYLENGLAVPRDIAEATESYRADMDPVGEFISGCVASEDGNHETARDMYRAYVAWCHTNSVKPFAEKTFANIMMQKGFKKETGRVRRYLNIRLTYIPADPDMTPATGAW